MKVGLVTRYETVETRNSDQTTIAAELSMISGQAANRAMPALAQALEGKDRNEIVEAAMLAADLFEASIGLCGEFWCQCEGERRRADFVEQIVGFGKRRGAGLKSRGMEPAGS
jgi:hypothetical protein